MSAKTRSILCWLLLAALSGGIGWLLDRSMPVGPRWELGPDYKYLLAEYTAGQGIWVRSRDGIALHDRDRGTHRCFDLKVGPEFGCVRSPDGRCLAVAFGDGSDALCLLDAQNQTLHQRNVPGLHQQAITKQLWRYLTFSQNGDWLYLHDTGELRDTTLAVLATVPAERSRIHHVAFEGDGPRLKVWLRDPNQVLLWDPGTQAWERRDEDYGFQVASIDCRYVMLQNRAKEWKLHDLRAGTEQQLGRSDGSLFFSLDAGVVVEQEISRDKEAVHLRSRVWSIARGEWSAPFTAPWHWGVHGVSANEQSILVNQEQGGVNVIDFHSGELISRISGRFPGGDGDRIAHVKSKILYLAIDRTRIAAIDELSGKVVWTDLRTGDILSTRQIFQADALVEIKIIGRNIALVEAHVAWPAWPAWLANWMDRVGWNTSSPSLRCVNLETGQGFAISTKRSTNDDLSRYDQYFVSLDEDAQSMTAANRHFYALKIASGGIACYALEPGPRWGYLLGMPAVCLAPFVLWHLWRWRGAIKPAAAGGSNLPSSDSLPTQRPEEPDIREEA